MSNLIQSRFNNPLLSDIEEYSKKTYSLTLTEEEIQTLKAYTQSRYSLINSNLRNSIIPKESIIIDTCLSKFNYDKKLKVYRKLYIKDLWTNPYAKKAFINILRDGYIIDKAYQSTSLNIVSFRSPFNVLLQLEVNGNQGAYISPFSHYSEEEEFLIKRDSRIDIKSYKVEENYGIITVEGKIR